MKTLLVNLLLSSLLVSAAHSAVLTLGNSATNRGSQDGWNPTLVIDRGSVIDITSPGPATPIDFSFHLDANETGNFTPLLFSVSENTPFPGARSHFTLVAIGDSVNVPPGQPAGAHTFPFGGSGAFFAGASSNLYGGFVSAIVGAGDGTGGTTSGNNARVDFAGGSGAALQIGNGTLSNLFIGNNLSTIGGAGPHNGARAYSFNVTVDHIAGAVLHVPEAETGMMILFGSALVALGRKFRERHQIAQANAAID